MGLTVNVDLRAAVFEFAELLYVINLSSLLIRRNSTEAPMKS